MWKTVDHTVDSTKQGDLLALQVYRIAQQSEESDEESDKTQLSNVYTYDYRDGCKVKD